MKGIENIIDRIMADARAEADVVIEKANEQAAVIRAEGEKAAQEAYLQRVREGTAACEARELRLKKTSEMEAKKSLLALKQEMLSAAFAQTLEAVSTLPEKERIGFLARLACRASAGGGEEICLNAVDRDSVGAAVVVEANRMLEAEGKPAGLILSGEIAAIRGGLLLKKNNITVNCSAETLVEALRNTATGEVAALLFD